VTQMLISFTEYWISFYLLSCLAQRQLF